MRLEARAPAKLNLCLYVGERRNDGLHEICSLFQAITLADTVTMELAEGREDEVVCPGVEGPNLAAVALARFREHFGWDEAPLRITIDKRIPVAAGLGGGSADAGAVLRMAVRAGGIGAHVDELQQLAWTIGADVPSQVEPGAHLVLGAGELAERLGKSWHVAAVLLTNERGLAAADVYAQHDRHKHRHGRRHLERDCRHLQKAVTGAGVDPLDFSPMLANDLEHAAVALEPSVEQALDLLFEAGAVVSRLSGSGPTTFGLFPSDEAAAAARDAIAPRWKGEAIVVHQAPSDYAVVRAS